MSNSMRTPLGQVRGLGSAKEGALHFITQRASAIALVFLVPWMIYSIVMIAQADSAQLRYDAALAFIQSPWNAVLTLITIGTSLYHMRLGLQVVIEDYIQKHSTKILLLLLNSFAAIVLFVITVYAVFSAAA